jgi:hypothetical protein
MIFDAQHLEEYRRATGWVTKQPGIMFPNRICCACDSRTTKTFKVKGTGTSRHNPAKYKCEKCHGSK